MIQIYADGYLDIYGVLNDFNQIAVSLTVISSVT